MAFRFFEPATHRPTGREVEFEFEKIYIENKGIEAIYGCMRPRMIGPIEKEKDNE